MHTGNSGDSETPVDVALRWYAAHGFDFVVVTDHNYVTAPSWSGTMLALPGVELTQNSEDCEPAEAPGVRCLLHVNALFVEPRAGKLRLPTPPSRQRRAIYGNALAVTRTLGGIALLNHPNFEYGADAELLAALAGDGLQLFELANEAIDSNNAGDAAHPSTEALWDAALGRGARLFGVATDDAHHYDDADAVRARGETAYTGDRGFVVVRAARDPTAIRAALQRGDFYASTGLLFASLAREGGALEVSTNEPVTIEFVGEGGAVLRASVGTRARMTLAEAPGAYLRARARAPSGARAWTQPVWR